jgi:hypothetical protein
MCRFEVLTAVVTKSTIFWDTRSSETSVYFQRIVRRYIPEDSTLHELIIILKMSERSSV